MEDYFLFTRKKALLIVCYILIFTSFSLSYNKHKAFTAPILCKCILDFFSYFKYISVLSQMVQYCAWHLQERGSAQSPNREGTLERVPLGSQDFTHHSPVSSRSDMLLCKFISDYLAEIRQLAHETASQKLPRGPEQSTL